MTQKAKAKAKAKEPTLKVFQPAFQLQHINEMNLGREVTPALKKLLTIGGDEAHIIVNQIMVLGLGVLVTEEGAASNAIGCFRTYTGLEPEDQWECLAQANTRRRYWDWSDLDRLDTFDDDIPF